MTRILIIKTAALGDVLRTTSVLPGLEAREPALEVTWVTAPSARDLVGEHPLIARVLTVDPGDDAAVDALAAELGADGPFDRLLALDDEESLCRLASAVPTRALSGAFRTPDGGRAYTDDVEPWFGMGLLARDGKAAADARKIENRKSHPQIYAEMLGVEMGRPQLPLPEAARRFAAEFSEREQLEAHGPVIGLNTGAGSRWRTKELPLDQLVEVMRRLNEELSGEVTFLMLGGPSEAERNQAAIERARRLDPAPRIVDAGTHNGLLDFSALVDRCALLLTSDSLALHIGVARGVGIVAFFAPTSAAEIELYGLGEKIQSTSPDYCSYRVDADNSSITADRIVPAVLRTLSRPREQG